MKHRVFILLGHLLVLTFILQAYMFLDSQDEFKEKILLIMLFPIWFVGGFRTWLFAPTISIFQEMIPEFLNKVCKDRYSAFGFGCLLSVLDLVVMIAIGLPLYLLYQTLNFSQYAVLWPCLFFIFFTVITLCATMGIVVLIGTKIKKS